MSEQSETSEAIGTSEHNGEDELEDIVVKVGFEGERRRIKFRGILLAEASNHSHQGPNQNRWHEWQLYLVQREEPSHITGEHVPARYRVLDTYCTCWQGESGHTTLSKPISAADVAREYPRLANEAIEEGTVDEAEFILDAGSEGHE